MASLKPVSDASSITGAKISRNQEKLLQCIEAIGTASVPAVELETVEDKDGADAVLAFNQALLLSTIMAIIRGEAPTVTATSFKTHTLTTGMAAANQRVIFVNIMHLSGSQQPQEALHTPLQIKHDMSSTAYITRNQRVLLDAVRAKKSSAFVVVKEDKGGCCVLL